MKDEEVMRLWYNSGGISANDSSLLATLYVLIKNGVLNFSLVYLGGGHWTIGKAQE